MNSCWTGSGVITVSREEKVSSVLLWQPADLIDLLLNLQTLQIVEVRLVTLERAVDIILTGFSQLLRFTFRLQ